MKKKPKKTARKPAAPYVRTVPDYTSPSVQCSHWFEEHGTHARQQCKRVQGHVGAHHCGGIKK